MTKKEKVKDVRIFSEPSPERKEKAMRGKKRVGFVRGPSLGNQAMPDWGGLFTSRTQVGGNATQGVADDVERTWSHIVQGFWRFCWKTFRASSEDIAALGERFTKVIVFSKDEINQACSRLQSALLGRFLGKGFSFDFVQRELRI